MKSRQTAPFWKFSNSTNDSAELLLYGPISESTWWGDEVTPKMFNDDLETLGDVKQIKVRINSPGGDVFAATAIYNSLKNHPAEITTYVDGLAASAASVIAMAGDTVIMPATAMLMIHNPSTGVWGDARALRNTADVLDTVRDSIIPAYEAKSKLGRSEITNLMNAGKDNMGTWMTAAEAFEKGFADEIDEQTADAVTMRGDLIISNGLGFSLKKFGLAPPPGLIATPLGVDDNSSETKTAEQTTVEVSNMADDQVTDIVEEPVAEPSAVEEPAAEEEIVDDVVTEDEITTEDPIMAERERIKAIRNLAAGLSGVDEIVDAAIDEGLSVEAAALQILQSDSVKVAQATAARLHDAAVVDGVTPGAAEPLTEEVIKNMTPDEFKARYAEILAYYKAKRGS